MLSEFRKILVLLFPFWKKYWKNEIIIVVMLIFSFFISLYTPLKFQAVIDSLVNYDSYSSFVIAVSLLGFLVLSRILISWFYAVYLTKVGESFIIVVTSSVYLSVLRKRRSFWMKFSPNDVLTRLTQDIVSVKSFLFDFLHNSFFQGIIILGILTVLFFLNSKAGIIITMLTVVAFISSYFGSSYLNERAFIIRQIASKFTHLFQIGISYPFLNFSWNLFSSHLEKYKTNAQEMRKEQVAFVNQIQLINQSISFVNLLIGTVFLFFVLRSDLYSGLISIGGMFSIIMYSSSVIQATTSLAASIVSTKLNRVSVLRINELLETSNTENTPYYKPQEKINHPFFKNELQRGFLLPNEDNFFIVLNSSNGSGKSTLAQVLTGFDNLSEKVYKESWFLLPAEPVVFEGSLFDNIRLISGRMLSPEEIYKIISDNNFDELLALFPNGIHSEISATSEMVSRGQKQAVGLIAAIIKDPTAIIIDEGINSLDSVVKSRIKDPLQKWLKKRKAILIDHEKLYLEEGVNIELKKESLKVIN